MDFYSHLKNRKPRKILRNENWVVYYPLPTGTGHTIVTEISIVRACDKFDFENPHVKCYRPTAEEAERGGRELRS